MKKLLLGVGLISFLVLGRLKPAWSAVADSSATPYREVSEVDYRQLELYLFLKEKQSPFSEHVEDIIYAADLWSVDWRLLPSIAGLESAFGKRMVPGTYNAYGWGGGYLSFENWQDSIYHVTWKLKDNYYRQGLDSPKKIARVYAPPNPNWGNLVSSIMRQI